MSFSDKLAMSSVASYRNNINIFHSVSLVVIGKFFLLNSLSM